MMQLVLLGAQTVLPEVVQFTAVFDHASEDQ
jgi:hypothetical protein